MRAMFENPIFILWPLLGVGSSLWHFYSKYSFLEYLMKLSIKITKQLGKSLKYKLCGVGFFLEPVLGGLLFALGAGK